MFRIPWSWCFGVVVFLVLFQLSHYVIAPIWVHNALADLSILTASQGLPISPSRYFLASLTQYLGTFLFLGSFGLLFYSAAALGSQCLSFCLLVVFVISSSSWSRDPHLIRKQSGCLWWDFVLRLDGCIYPFLWLLGMLVVFFYTVCSRSPIFSLGCGFFCIPCMSLSSSLGIS